MSLHSLYKHVIGLKFIVKINMKQISHPLISFISFFLFEKNQTLLLYRERSGFDSLDSWNFYVIFHFCADLSLLSNLSTVYTMVDKMC